MYTVKGLPGEAMRLFLILSIFVNFDAVCSEGVCTEHGKADDGIRQREIQEKVLSALKNILI